MAAGRKILRSLVSEQDRELEELLRAASRLLRNSRTPARIKTPRSKRRKLKR